jgi:hypothetical protein
VRPLLLVALAATALAVVLAGPLGGAGEPAPPLVPGSGKAPGESELAVDPLAYDPDVEDELAEAAARGFAHPLYARVPGGAPASAARVARHRPLVEAVAEEGDLDADELEALVYLESAGRPDAAADPRLEGAVGLTQIVAQTGRDLLDMRVDPRSARRLTRRIARAERRGRRAEAERLRDRRRAVDERFDPLRALRGTARYLRFAREQLGRADLALVSYHMGVGNLRSVQRAFGDRQASYAQLYFDSSPLSHPAAWRLLSSFGDDSATYLWRLRAAQEIMALHRDDPDELGRRAARMTAKNSREEVLHPRERTEVFSGPRALRDAYEDGDLRPLPEPLLSRHRIRVDRQMGELAVEPELYRGLRAEALAVLVYLAAGAEALAGPGQLTLTSTVRDRTYQRRLATANPQATTEYSLHTTGFAFDLAKRFRSEPQERAVRFMLRRLQAHDVVAWIEEYGAFHVVAGGRAGALEGVLEREPG